MKLMTKLVITGSVVAAAAAAILVITPRKGDRLRQDEDQDEGTAVQHGDTDLGIAVDLGDPGDRLVEDNIVIATSSGMADVDPEPLAQTVGEGIALEPTEAAHTEIRELRERLPRPGKGI